MGRLELGGRVEVEGIEGFAFCKDGTWYVYGEGNTLKDLLLKIATEGGDVHVIEGSSVYQGID